MSGPVTVYVSKVVGSNWGWLAAALIAGAAPRFKTSFVRAEEFLISAVLAYYLCDSVAGVYGQGAAFETGKVLMDGAFYAILSTIVATGLAVLHKGMARRGILGMVCALVVPVFISYDALSLHASLGKVAWADPYLLKVTLFMGVVAVLWSVGVVIARIVGPVRLRRGDVTVDDDFYEPLPMADDEPRSGQGHGR